jgi:hypothetical protein
MDGLTASALDVEAPVSVPFLLGYCPEFKPLTYATPHPDDSAGMSMLCTMTRPSFFSLIASHGLGPTLLSF